MLKPREPMPASPAYLTIEGLEKSFGAGSKAIDGVTLSVAQGECLVLLGPSGCGKTTTLRCVAGFEQAEKGRISIGGRVVFDSERNILIPPADRGIGMVFQSFAIWPHMTVFENVAYPLRVRQRPKSEVNDRVRAALDLVGLSDFDQRGASALSGGQMQRVALARSLVYEPSLLLLDEPLSSLDVALRERLRFEIKSVLEKTGTTAIYVTHDQAEAVVVGSRIAVMKDGRVAQFGTPEEIYQRPESGFVANFTGASNRLSAKLASASDERATLMLDDGSSIRVDIDPASSAQATTIGKSYELALRPESMRLTARKPAADLNAVAGTITRARFLGTHTSYTVTTAAGADLVVNTYGSFVEFKEGERVFMTFEPSDATVLP